MSTYSCYRLILMHFACHESRKHLPPSGDFKDDETEPEEDYAFWRPFSLRYERLATEKDFHSSVIPGWHMRDVVAYALSIPFAPIFFKALGPEIPSWHVAVVAFISGFFAPLQVFGFIKQRYEPKVSFLDKKDKRPV